jgi:hypothetical protein
MPYNNYKKDEVTFREGRTFGYVQKNKEKRIVVVESFSTATAQDGTKREGRVLMIQERYVGNDGTTYLPSKGKTVSIKPELAADLARVLNSVANPAPESSAGDEEDPFS